jgi:hypothetical protein
MNTIIVLVLIVGAVVTTVGTAKVLVKSDDFYNDGPLSIAVSALLAGLVWPLAIPLGLLTRWIRNLQERQES